MSSDRVVVQQVQIGPMMNFIYLIGCTQSRAAAIVDPAWDVPAILKLANASNFTIRDILISHGHPDHINGLEALLDATGARVHINKDEVEYMRNVARSFGMSTGFMEKKSGNFNTVSDNDTDLIGALPVEFLHTPGHSPGSQCFLVENNLFSGDTLFIGACGRVDMPGGEPEKMWWSLNKRLRSLDDGIVVYPGHDYGMRVTSTMGEQKQANPYMNYDSVKQFIRDMGV